MADNQFLRLGEGWALAYDGNQWIVQRRGAFDRRRGNWNWKARSFPSSKASLRRCLRELGVELDQAARNAIDDLPDTFAEWLSHYDPALLEQGSDGDVAQPPSAGPARRSEGDDGATERPRVPEVPERGRKRVTVRIRIGPRRRSTPGDPALQRADFPEGPTPAVPCRRTDRADARYRRRAKPPSPRPDAGL